MRLHLSCLDVVITLRTGHGDDAELLRRLFVDTIVTTADEASAVLHIRRAGQPGIWQLIDSDGERATASTDTLARTTLQQVNAIVRRHATTTIWHAGAVARDGQAVILAGLSGSGKSSLAAECGRSDGTDQGWDVLSDELISFPVDDADDVNEIGGPSVRGSGLPLNFKPGSSSLLPWLTGEGPVPISQISSLIPQARTAALVLLAPYRPGPLEWHRIGGRDAALSLAQLGVPVQDHDGTMLAVLQHLVESVPSHVMAGGTMPERRTAIRSLVA